jgi:signal peptidase II
MQERATLPWAAALAIALAVLAADQATKAWVLRAPPGTFPVTVVPGFFDVVHSRNTGGVFGLFSGAPSAGRRAFFVGATVVALGAMGAFIRLWGRESRLLLVALSLVAGGAVGNLVDRLRFGSVVDFIDWHWRAYHWYTFNVADAAISSGAALLLLQSLLPERRGQRADAGTRPPDGAGA